MFDMGAPNISSCCGIGEICGLKRPDITLAEASDYGVFQYNIYVFTDAVSYKAGKRLAEYIIKHKLGTITTSKPERNPNTRRLVQVWIWNVDKKAANKWLKSLD